MAIYRNVYTSFWEDPRVVEEMTPEDKLFYLYLMTNPCTTMIGIYSITKKRMAYELGYSMETVNVLMDRFENYHSLIVYNQETREIALLNWGKYNLNRGGKPVEDCVKKDLSLIKDEKLIRLVSERVTNKTIKALYDARLGEFDDTSDDTSTTRGQNQNQNLKPKPKPKKDNTSEKPKKRKQENLSSIEDIENFVASQKLSNVLGVDSSLLVDYLDLIRLHRRTTRISLNVVKGLVEKLAKYTPIELEFAFKVHVEGHDDKPEQYTLGILRKSNEEKAAAGLQKIKGGATNAKSGGGYRRFNGSDSTNEGALEINTVYYDQFPGMFAE